MASIVKRGDKYLVRVTRKGQPQANKSFASRRDAEAWAATVEADIARGTYRRNIGDRVTFRELAERYLAEVTPTKRGAVKEAYRLSAMLRADSAARPMLCKLVSDLSPADVTVWRGARSREVSASTLKREWVILAHVLEVARLEWGLVGLESPFKQVRKPDVRDSRNRRISQAELEAVVEATESAELGVFIRLAVETCARRSELLAVRWHDIDFKASTARLRSETTKNGEARILPLSPVALVLLRSIPRRLDGRVFSLKADSVSQAFRRAVSRARGTYLEQCAVAGTQPDPEFLVGVRLHDARHEGVSRLAERGWSAMEVAGVSGHKTISLLQRYTHLRPENLARKLAATA